MHNINLIFTTHKESGNCNSIELHEIIERINPEIIFEELSYSNFNKVYKENSLTTLETNAIKKYLQNYDIEHIPVDTYNLPNSYYKNLEFMLERITSSIMIESRDLRNVLDDQLLLISQYGFNYLNSDRNDELLGKYIILKEKILNKINNDNLFQIASLEKEVIEKRENEIIDNIYSFSEEHVYDQAIIFIGSGHRKAMIRKIYERKTQEKIELKWTLFNNKAI